MALIAIKPTKVDVAVAEAIAERTSKPVEEIAQALTWAADEHVLLGLTAGLWAISRLAKQGEVRRQGTHLLLTMLAASALPHVMKSLVDQERPDRAMAGGRRRGIPLSGKKYDAFPSGHAVHIGALASAACLLPRRQRNAIWAMGGVLALTRVVLLAHWASDVVAGLAVGALLERAMRRLTGLKSTDAAAAKSRNPSSTTRFPEARLLLSWHRRPISSND